LNEIHWVDWLTIVLYMAGMVAIGLWLSRKHKNFDDFFLAGRMMTTPLLVATLVSTYYGLDVLFGTSELGFTSGIVAWFGYSRPTYVFFILAAFLLAKKLRAEDFKSLPDILNRYYGGKTRVVAAVSSFLYSLPVLSLFGFGWLGNVVFGWEPIVGAAVFGGIALAYTLGGGLWAVALTDAVQFVLMCTIIAVAVPFCIDYVGGFPAMFENLAPSYWTQTGGMSPWLIAVYGMTGLTILVEPAFYQRIFAAKSYKHVRNALLVGLFLWGAYDWCVTLIGMAAKSGSLSGALPADMHPNAALLEITLRALPVGLVGLFISGAVAAAMSTVDSYCLVAGGNVAYDLYRPLVKPNASDNELVKATRFGVILSWVIGFMIAFYFERMMSIWVVLATLLASVVLVPILLGLYVPSWRRPPAGFVSAIAGLATAVSFYVVMGIFGTNVEGTRILTVSFMGGSFEIMEEYAMLLSLPASLAGFFIGLSVAKARRRQ